MPDIDEVLDAQHEVYAKTKDAWAAEERRLHGGYPMLVELERFTNETDESYTSRQRQSPLLNFGRTHGGIVIGHLNEVAPMPNYGTLGPVRERKAIPRGQETAAERFHYNANGVGTNGLTFTAFSSGIQLRTLATGFRWTMVEMPRWGNPDAPIRKADIDNGFRPFIVEYSPRAVPMWQITDGRLDFAVVRTRWTPEGPWTPQVGQKGYYLLVRQGYDGLGGDFAGGGWWLYDPEKNFASQGTWNRTRGEIPMTMYVAEESEGTEDYPAVATMPLMELNQLSSSLMNRISERNSNARNASKSQKNVLGAEPKTFNEAMEVALAGSYYIPWQPFVGPDGHVIIPTIYDGANGAVESSVYAEIIRSHIEEAHEIMVRQMTSTPDSTGESKKAGFNEATSPILSGLAIRRESWENTVIPWVEMRAGAEQPSGFVQWPTEFDLTPVAQKIQSWYESALKIGARSASVEAIGAEKLATEAGMWPEKESEADIARDELKRSIAGAIVAAVSPSMQQLTTSGAPLEGAATELGLSPEQVATLVGGSPDGSPDQSNPDAGVVVAGEGAVSAIPEGEAVGAGNSAAVVPPSPAVPPPAPQVDLSEVTSRLDALAEQIAALVGALATKQAEPPPPPHQQPPMVIAIPQSVAPGKRITMQTESGQPITIDVQPIPPAEEATTANGATP